jgi:hypothetical protein
MFTIPVYIKKRAKNEVDNYWNELRYLGLVGRRDGNMKTSGTDFASLHYITKEGIIESNQDQDQQRR